MLKESKFAKTLRRDEVLWNKIYSCTFSMFIVSIFMWPVKILTDVFSNLVTFAEVKYTLMMIGINIILFMLCLFLALVAKKKHFNNFNALVTSIIASSVLCIINRADYQPMWFMIIAWILITLLAYILVKILFNDFKKNLIE